MVHLDMRASDGTAMTAPTASDAKDDAAPGLETKTGGLGSRAQAVALATLCAVLFLTFLDNTIVSVGLADVQSNLHAGVASLQWVVNGYALTFAAFMLAGGTLGDLFGRKKIMLTGVAIFCAGSVLAALAPNVDWLIAVGSSSWVWGRRHPNRARCRSSATSTPTRTPGPTLSGMGCRLGSGPRSRPCHRWRSGRHF